MTAGPVINTQGSVRSAAEEEEDSTTRFFFDSKAALTRTNKSQKEAFKPVLWEPRTAQTHPLPSSSAHFLHEEEKEENGLNLNLSLTQIRASPLARSNLQPEGEKCSEMRTLLAHGFYF